MKTCLNCGNDMVLRSFTEDNSQEWECTYCLIDGYVNQDPSDMIREENEYYQSLATKDNM